MRAHAQRDEGDLVMHGEYRFVLRPAERTHVAVRRARCVREQRAPPDVECGELREDDVFSFALLFV